MFSLFSLQVGRCSSTMSTLSLASVEDHVRDRYVLRNAIAQHRPEVVRQLHVTETLLTALTQCRFMDETETARVKVKGEKGRVCVCVCVCVSLFACLFKSQIQYVGY